MLNRRCYFVFLLTALLSAVIFIGGGSSGSRVVVASDNMFVEEALATAVQVSAGGGHSCAVTSVGGVKCWGSNQYGQLGNDSNINSWISVDVVGLNSGVTSVSTGWNYTCAITNVGGVKCWGRNQNGQLGNDSNIDSNVPVDVVGLNSGVTFVSTGYIHTCAITNVGGVKCWGWNIYGQLGNNSNINSWVPVDVVGLNSGVTSVFAGDNHTCAVTSVGGVKCWGNNFYGQLGNNSNTKSYVPVDVVGLNSGVISVSTGRDYTCSITNISGVKCWGRNQYGQLGNDSNINSNVPVDVVGLNSGVTSVSAGVAHTCTITSVGGVKCWGNNYSGQLGNNSNINSWVPVDVVGLTAEAIYVASGGGHNCAVTSVGGVKCWGNNYSGQLGNDSNINSNVPIDVVGFEDIPIITPECDDLTDTDGDALPDGWEVCGYDHNNDGTIDVDLPAMGADWRHKDFFLEIDYMEFGLFTNYKPSDATVSTMVSSFASISISNPDGNDGIHLHVDYGSDSPLTWGAAATWSTLSESNELPYWPVIFDSGEWSDYFDKMQFSEARQHVFHYEMIGHNLALNLLGVVGAAYPDYAGHQYIAISHPSSYSPQEVAGATMHELGHNLALLHGGQDDIRFKPNYFSIMNESYTKSGLSINGQTGNYIFSEFGSVETLFETDLDEGEGLNWLSSEDLSPYKTVYYCNGVPKVVVVTGSIDWDCDGITEPSVVADINQDSQISPSYPLESYSDIEFMRFDGGCIGTIGNCDLPTVLRVQNNDSFVAGLPTVEIDEFPDVYKPYAIEMPLGYTREVSSELSATVPITIVNTGTEVSTVNITYETSSTIFDLNGLPSSVVLQPDEVYVVDVSFNTVGATIAHEELIVYAIVQENTNWTGDTHIELVKASSLIYLPVIIK